MRLVNTVLIKLVGKASGQHVDGLILKIIFSSDFSLTGLNCKVSTESLLKDYSFGTSLFGMLGLMTSLMP